MNDSRNEPGPADAFPQVGRTADDIKATLTEWHRGDIDWRNGRAFSLVYHPDDAALEDVLHDVGTMFLHENALNPFKYPSLVQMEAEVVAMGASLFHTVPKAGTMSSGGTESVFLAVHTTRSHGEKQRGITGANIVTADTAHPAFAKACHYLGLELRRAATRADGRADVAAMASLVDDRTVLVVGSAPCYPFGVIDPIPELAAMASEAGALMHVNACLGGWMLPWWERLGEPVPPWDFRVPGVTSLSADVHKYGYTFKGASLILYHDPELVQHQWFLYDDWPGGLYGSVTTAGTRPAAPIAGAWAAINFLGQEGYLRKAAQVRDATRAFQAGIAEIPELRITSNPDLSVFEFGAADPTTLDIAAVGDVMDDRGWNLDRQTGGLHVMVSPYHAHVVDDFLADLRHAVATHGPSRGGAAGYGGIAGREPDPGMKLLTRFDGVVLTGGRSTRMGTDKAFIEVGPDRRPLVGVSRHTLVDAGALRVLSIGGDEARLGALGFETHPDDHPDEGPLGGLVTGLHLAGQSIVVVLTCDLPAIDGATIRALVDALDGDPRLDAAVPRLAGREQILTAAYRRRVHGSLLAAYEAGERSVRRAVAPLATVHLDHLAADVRDVDRPEDLHHYAEDGPRSERDGSPTRGAPSDRGRAADRPDLRDGATPHDGPTTRG